MTHSKIVDLKDHIPKAPPPVTDFWFAQVDTRLGRIEHIIRRLEWQIWMIFCGLGAVLVLAIVETLAPTQ